MNASLLDEGTLSVEDKLIHEWGKAKGKHLGNNLCYGVDEANWPKV
jgi:hypothetical protein